MTGDCTTTHMYTGTAGIECAVWTSAFYCLNINQVVSKVSLHFCVLPQVDKLVTLKVMFLISRTVQKVKYPMFAHIT